jgi:hypothetical protein
MDKQIERHLEEQSPSTANGYLTHGRHTRVLTAADDATALWSEPPESEVDADSLASVDELLDRASQRPDASS